MQIDFDFKTINTHYHKYFKNKKRFLLFYGSRGSAKSRESCAKILFRILTEQNHKVLAVRKVARTLRHSIFAQFIQLIDFYDLYEICNINKSDLEISFPKLKSKIIFAGCDDPAKLKSLTGLTAIIIEEVNELTEKEFNEINLLLRGKTANYKQIIGMFNPESKNSWLYKRFVLNANKKIESLVHCHYRHNKHLDKEYIKELENLIDKDKYLYDVYCKGEFGIIEGTIYKNWEIQDLSEYRFSEFLRGLDFGYAKDPCAFLEFVYKNNTIYVLNEFYMYHARLEDLSDRIREYTIGGLIIGDSAEPRSIQELRRDGINIIGAIKGKDSVMHGIKWIQSKKIIVDAKCKLFINELQDYRWRIDKDGNTIQSPVGTDHLCDCLRYGLEHYIRYGNYKNNLPDWVTADAFGF